MEIFYKSFRSSQRKSATLRAHLDRAFDEHTVNVDMQSKEDRDTPCAPKVREKQTGYVAK